MPIYNYLPIAFPWYDNIKKQNRFKDNVGGLCTYKLISPRDALLPFQFYKPAALEFPVNWYIRDVHTQEIIADLTPSLNNAALGVIWSRTTSDGKDYYWYNGVPLTTTGGPLNLNTGFYESILTFPGGASFYSEMFHVPAISFSVLSDTLTKYLRIEWYSDSDLPPIMYNTDSAIRFKNVCYLDTFVHISEPEINEDTEKDGFDNDIATFQRAVIKYRITELVPDYLKIALVLMQMHGHVFLSTANGIDIGEFKNMTTETQAEGSGGLSTIDILFEQDLAIINKGCNNSISLKEIVSATPVLNSVVTSGAYLFFTGIATPDTFLHIYGAVSENATYNIVSQFQNANQLNAGTLKILVSAASGYSWFKVFGFNFNKTFGLSNAVQKT